MRKTMFLAILVAISLTIGACGKPIDDAKTDTPKSETVVDDSGVTKKSGRYGY